MSNTGNNDGNSTGHESANASRPKHLTRIERIKRYASEIVKASTDEIANPTRNAFTAKTALVNCEVAALLIGDEITRLEEGLSRRESSDGSTEENAQEVVPRTARALKIGQEFFGNRPYVKGKGTVTVMRLETGLQLCFELFCTRCHFQCWDCPTCYVFRCRCNPCGCTHP